MDKMADFGFRFLGLRTGTGVPNFAAWMVTSRQPNEGRCDRTVSLDDPDRVAKANADWYELSSEHGLFSKERRFLVSLELPLSDAVDEVGELIWGEVELADEWDVMGLGAASGVLGWARGCPGFAMSSLDGSVFLQGTVWQDSIGTAVLPDTYSVASLRDAVRRNVGKPYRTAADNADALTWLNRADGL
ncbi:hypothetical protein ACIBD9_00650 [Micromonospora sp. NPDC050784]|uniref:hypothetical protein n=1 Tax=Micromonospora sp. NPDC050784 TaxID=3364281 RepID=UPI0037BB2C62